MLAGCPGSLEFTPVGGGGTGGAGGTAGVCDAPTQVFGAPGAIGKCNFCHTAGGTAPDLSTPNVMGMSVSTASLCVGQAFINTTDRGASVILKRIMGTTCGDQMPLGSVLTPVDMACVTSWVDGQP